MKKILSIVMALCLLLGTTGALAQTAGAYTATQPGYGGDVTVTLTLEEGKITQAAIEGANETENVGQAAFATLQAQLLEAQSAGIDGVAGATVTSGAVRLAAQACLDEANGVEAAPVQATLKDGTYTAQTWSFNKSYPMNVAVTIKDNAIESIVVGENGDTVPVLESATSLLIPRMIEQQSVKVDAICGATVSSNAIKAATEDCLKQAIEAAGGDVAAVSAFYVASPKVDAAQEITTDVLVVGLGGSGIAAAKSAAETQYKASGEDASKVSVLGIDKAGKYGGTSALTTSPMSINPSYFVEKNNGENYVDAELLKSKWMEYTEGDAKEWAIDIMMNESGNAIDWLIDNGFEFGEPAQGLSEPYKVCVNYGGTFGNNKEQIATYYNTIMDKYTDIGGKYMLETEARNLIVENGAVTGVVAVGADGTTYTIHAKSVVLATGGFAGNGEMENKYLSDEYYPLTGGTYNLYGMAQNDGKMIQSAIDNGAATYNIGMAPISHIGGAIAIMRAFEVLPAEGVDMWTGKPATQSLNDVTMMMAIAPNALAVNRTGTRFVDETQLAAYGNWQAGPSFYTLWSDAMIKEIETEGLRFSSLGIFINQGGWPANTPIPEVRDVLAKAEEQGIVIKADTLEGLAEKLNIDPAVLSKTVTDYNTYCDTRENPADGIVKSDTIYDLSGNPVPSEKSTFEKVEGDGPYYAVVGSPWIYSTCGALDINESFQVLNTSGDAIGGLYAVGTDSMGVLFTEKHEYVPYGGAAQGWAFTSGYLAGPIVAENAAK